MILETGKGLIKVAIVTERGTSRDTLKGEIKGRLHDFYRARINPEIDPEQYRGRAHTRVPLRRDRQFYKTTAADKHDDIMRGLAPARTNYNGTAARLGAHASTLGSNPLTRRAAHPHNAGLAPYLLPGANLVSRALGYGDVSPKYESQIQQVYTPGRPLVTPDPASRMSFQEFATKAYGRPYVVGRM